MVSPGPGSFKSPLLFWQKAGQVYQGRAGSCGVLPTFQVTQCGSRGRAVQPAQSVHQGCIQLGVKKALCHPSLQIHASPCRDKG